MSQAVSAFLGLLGMLTCCVAGCVFDESGFPGSSDNNNNGNGFNNNANANINANGNGNGNGNGTNSNNNNNVPQPSCGDGVVDPSEGCDDSNLTDGDGCSQGCQVEPGWSCSGEPSLC